MLVLASCQPLSNKAGIAQIFREKPSQKSQENSSIPETHQQFESRELNTQKAVQKKVQVALFLPFSGKNKDLGWSLFNAASMSLFENDLNHNVELILIDSKETAQEAQKAFAEVVERNIKIVIGPVFSQSIETIESSAKKNKITVISLSNNQLLMGKTTNEGGIFLAGMLLEAQIDKIVGYSLAQGKFSFSIVAPNSQYGNTVTAMFKKIVKGRDGTFVTAEFYESNEKDIDRIADHVVNAFVVAPHSKKSKKTATSESDRTYSQVIMIPESGKILSKIVAAIKAQNKDERDFQIIGTNQWDDSSTLSDYNLLGGWFAAPESEKFRAFEKNYYQTYSKFPPRISSITYDLVAAISKLVDRQKGEVPTINDFTNPANPPINGFSGIDGTFRFLPNGLVQRNLAVLRVGNGRFDSIEKPVDKFLKY